MYPRTVNGKKYCCESIRIDRRRTTSRSYGRCNPNSKTECEKCNHNNYLKDKVKVERNPGRSFKIPFALMR